VGPIEGAAVVQHPEILVFGYSEASMRLRHGVAPKVEAIVSIQGQRDPCIDCAGITHSLVLRFDDVDAPDPSDPMSIARFRVQQRRMADVGLTIRPPTIDHARLIIEFAREVSDVAGPVVFQCEAGISRSSAAGLLCLATWTGEGHEQYCVERLLRVRPAARPLKCLVAFGDALLGRGGTLVSSLSRALQI
jgi:predicted protein tyrosine phosphatase